MDVCCSCQNGNYFVAKAGANFERHTGSGPTTDGCCGQLFPTPKEAKSHSFSVLANTLTKV